VQLDAAGVIDRHRLQYGKRGAFQKFIVGALQNTTMVLAARDLTLQACDYSQLELATKIELRALQNSLRPRL
jgi:hypothetical protein